MKHVLVIILMFTLFACSVKPISDDPNTFVEIHQDASFLVSEPLVFDNIDALHDYANNNKPESKADGDFISYAETVMQEPDYDERPNAILSTKFGSILNSDGEVIVDGYFGKLSSIGILIGSVERKETIRTLSEEFTTLTRCETTTRIESLNPYADVFEIDGYEYIYLFDLFGLLVNRASDNQSQIITKSPAPNLVTYNKNLGDLNMISDPYADFTVPPSGSQKVLFDDSHCNDTKIWQKEYFFIMDRGIKIKTMQKGFLGIWSKFQNPVEGGVMNWVIEETGSFNAISGSTADINKIQYDDRSTVSHNIYTISARGQSLSSIMSINLQQKINQGNALADSHNLNLEIDGVRFVVSNTKAYTRFPNRVESANVEKIEKDWPTLFIGTASVNTSSILGNNDLLQRIPYHVHSALLYGQSTWSGATKGSKMVYNYN